MTRAVILPNGRKIRLGDRMAETCALLAYYPHITQAALSRAVGPHGSNQYGYRTIMRCVQAGLINKYNLKGTRVTLELTYFGWLVANDRI